MSVPDDPLHLAVEQLEWIAALKEYFEFRADESTILFWRVGYQPRSLFLPPLIFSFSRTPLY